MRTTWLILITMLLVGAGMYYFATRSKASAAYDHIAIQDTPDSISVKTSLFASASQPELHFSDSSWFHQDSTPLKQILLDSSSVRFDKHYSVNTFLIDYDHAWFYDFAVNKPDVNKAYSITFAIGKSGDTLMVHGTIDDQEGHLLRFSGPMIKMYRSFVLSYNNGQTTDSTQVADSTNKTDAAEDAPPGIVPAKTISVLRS